MAADLKNSKPIFVICDNIRSLSNVGIIFRLCDALAVKKLYLCGITGHPKYGGDMRRYEISERADKEIRKTAIKNVDNVDWEYRENIVDLIKELKAQEIQIVALEQTPKSINYLKAEYNYPLAIVLGHEVDGICSEAIDMADLKVEIPMLGTGHSLNVATSFAVLGYKIREN